jgi:hypothetical protein
MEWMLLWHKVMGSGAAMNFELEHFKGSAEQLLQHCQQIVEKNDSSGQSLRRILIGFQQLK